MLRIRVVKTASGSRAVQIIYYQNRDRKIFKHIGSGRTDEEIHALKLAEIHHHHRTGTGKKMA